MYRELSHPIRESDSVSEPRQYQPMIDCDTVCPPKKRALFDYNREQARKINSAENGRTWLQLDEESKNQFHSVVNFKRQPICSNKLKLDRLDHESEIRPRSDSLHSVISQCSEISSIDSLNSSSRESSPVMVEDIHKYETPLRNSIIVVNRSGSDSKMHTEENTDLTEMYTAEKINIAKDHETPERNSMLVLNGIKSVIQKPLFTQDSVKYGDTEKSRPVISKTLFPLNQEALQNFEQNLFQKKHDMSQNYIPGRDGQPFQYSNIPDSETSQNKQFVNIRKHSLNSYSSNSEKKEVESSLKTDFDAKNKSAVDKLSENFNSSNGVVCKEIENALTFRGESSSKTTAKKHNSSRILGDVTNSLNTEKKLAKNNNSVLGNLTSDINSERKSVEQNFQEIYTCSFCNKQFRQRGNFHSHMQSHKESSRICKCGICDVEFDNTDLLQAHMRVAHTGSQPYKCEKCNREFSQFNNLRRHMRVHREKTYKCHLCDRIFNEEFYLKMHVGTHTGQRVYSCGICNAPFPSNQELKAHVKTHSPSELHNCNICGKSFSKACVLRQHKKTHSGERPHHCMLCAKTFIHRHHLTMHMRSHEENKPYTCEICSKVFTQTSHLYKHQRQHEEETLENNTNGFRDESNTTRKKMHMSHENNLNPHNQKHFRQNDKENLENKNPNVMKSRRNGKKTESRILKNNNIAMNYHANVANKSQGLMAHDLMAVKNELYIMNDKMKLDIVKDAKEKTVDSDYPRNTANVKASHKENGNGNTSQIVNHNIERFFGGTDAEKNESVNLTKRSLELALNDLEKSKSKKVKHVRENVETDKHALQITVESNSRPDIQPAIPQPLSGNSSGTSLSSVSTAPTKLPSFNSITSGLKESYPKWTATNSHVPAPYYQSPSYEQPLYQFGYPSMAYDSSAMYLAYSAQMQAYYNMLYYNSKALVDNQYRSSETGYTLHNTSVVNEKVNEELENSKIEYDQRDKLSEKFSIPDNNTWYPSPELSSILNNGKIAAVNKKSDSSEQETKMVETSIKPIQNGSNTLLIAALEAGLPAETGSTRETHTNEHILKLMKLKDRFIEENPNHAVNCHLSESVDRNQIYPIVADAVCSAENSLIDEIHADQASFTAVLQTNRNEYEKNQSMEISEENVPAKQLYSTETENDHVNQRINVEPLEKLVVSEKNLGDKNLIMANDRITEDDKMAESTKVLNSDKDETVGSETDTLESDQTQIERKEEIMHSEYCICCDTCSFTFSCKDDLKRHFMENPVCFSKVCETSKISEEFGWQLLDYYLASLEIYKVYKTEDDRSKKIERNPSLGDASFGTHQQTTSSVVQQNIDNMRTCSNVEVDSNLISESQKSSDSNVLENDNHDLVMNAHKGLVENQGQNVMTATFDHLGEKSSYRETEDGDMDKCKDVENFVDISEISERLNNEKQNKEENPHVTELSDKLSTENVHYSQESMCHSLTDGNQTGLESNRAIEQTADVLYSDKCRYPVNLNEKQNDIKLVEEQRKESDIMKTKKDHKKKSEMEENQKLICQFCEGNFEDEKTLNLHIATHPTDKPFTCIQCNRNFTHKHNLKRHKMSHSDRCVECRVCKRSFKEIFYLQMHMKVHLQENSQKCEICGQIVAKADISNHVNGHIRPIEENPTYAQIAERVEQILNENAEVKNENPKSEVLDLSNKSVSKESLMKMSVEQLKSFMLKGRM